jgi:hypothetical protein
MNRTRSLTVGLVLAGLLGLGDIATLPFGDGEHPPLPVAIVGAVLGLITVVGVVLGWRGRRSGITAVIVTRLLSALAAVPAFFADGVPAPAVGAAAVGIAVTLASVALVAPALRTPVAPAMSS